MAPEPSSPGDPMTVRLVGGPYDGQIVDLPGWAAEWEITEPGHWSGTSFVTNRWVPERRHRYRPDPHWSEFVGVDAIPFTYAGVTEEDADP